MYMYIYIYIYVRTYGQRPDKSETGVSFKNNHTSGKRPHPPRRHLGGSRRPRRPLGGASAPPAPLGGSAAAPFPLGGNEHCTRCSVRTAPAETNTAPGAVFGPRLRCGT